MIHCYLIPIFNEKENLDSLYSNLIHHLDQNVESFFLFVDDCSTDGSVELIKSLFSSHPFHVITKETNQGPGHSFNLGFKYILNNYPDSNELKIITMEADNTSDIKLLSSMLSISNLDFDLVLASVYAQGGGFSKTSFIRKFLSFTANMMFRSVFDVKVLTLSSFYRIYDIGIIRKIEERYKVIIKEDGFICMLEILLKSIAVNAKVIEVPMLLKSDERVGKSKMKIFKNSVSYLRFLMTFKRNQN